MSKLAKFNELFEVPPAMRQYAELIVTPLEMDLILAMNGQSMSAQQVAQAMNLTSEQAQELMDQAYKRHVVNKEVDGQKVGYIFDYIDETGKEIRYIPAKFYDRLDHLTMYDNWNDIPEEVRKQISDWWLRGYAEKIAPVVEKIKEDPDAYQQIKQKDFLLLEEALQQVEAAEFHAVVNCDCRSSEQACDRMVETCIRFDDGARYTVERGLGRVLTKEECKEVVINTDRDGLMHIGTKDMQHGLFGFCNCCTCCCFPLRASKILDSEKVYPRVHYQAVRKESNCNHCGRCVKRCQFKAFHFDGSKVEIKGKQRKHVSFDPQLCFGCGLCANACPSEAIEMKKIT
jgi:ferredoxin